MHSKMEPVELDAQFNQAIIIAEGIISVYFSQFTKNRKEISLTRIINHYEPIINLMEDTLHQENFFFRLVFTLYLLSCIKKNIPHSEYQYLSKTFEKYFNKPLFSRLILIINDFIEKNLTKNEIKTEIRSLIKFLSIRFTINNDVPLIANGNKKRQVGGLITSNEFFFATDQTSFSVSNKKSRTNTNDFLDLEIFLFYDAVKFGVSKANQTINTATIEAIVKYINFYHQTDGDTNNFLECLNYLNTDFNALVQTVFNNDYNHLQPELHVKIGSIKTYSPPSK